MTNIGVDIHGTIDSDPDYFKKILQTLIENGHRIIIISGPPTNQIVSELNELKLEHGVHFHNIISVVDFLKQNRAKMWQDEKGHWWCDDEIWWKSKYRICLMYDIKIIIDDKREYKKYFTGSDILFSLWNSKDKTIDYEISENPV